MGRDFYKVHYLIPYIFSPNTLTSFEPGLLKCRSNEGLKTSQINFQLDQPSTVLLWYLKEKKSPSFAQPPEVSSIQHLIRMSKQSILHFSQQLVKNVNVWSKALNVGKRIKQYFHQVCKWDKYKIGNYSFGILFKKGDDEVTH